MNPSALRSSGYLAVCAANTTEIITDAARLRLIHDRAAEQVEALEYAEPYLDIQGDAWALLEDTKDVRSLYRDELLSPEELIKWKGEIDRLQRRYNAEVILSYPHGYREYQIHMR